MITSIGEVTARMRGKAQATHDQPDQADQAGKAPDQPRDLHDVEPDRHAVPGQELSWEEKRDQMSHQDHHDPVVKRHRAQEQLSPLQELRGETGEAEARLPVAPDRLHEEDHRGDVRKDLKRSDVP
jgi:hypothetical protein